MSELNKDKELAGYEAIFNTHGKEYKFIEGKLHYRFLYPEVHEWEKCFESELNNLIAELLSNMDITSYLLNKANNVEVVKNEQSK